MSDHRVQMINSPSPLFNKLRNPYSAYVDKDFPLPRGYRVPDFTRFSGDDEMTPIEHIAQFIHQDGDTAANDF
ncbi:hypothetical protein MLD38_033838 [Melastoma candidum]|uniref:Uncharacterized protein n=1 Tax=Melastoma candidum TaxID=119954 RepID=A0ACB9M8L7_9MYRT|nr:hypothetical protein MLD38_033838 [Melastoma candidum]